MNLDTDAAGSLAVAGLVAKQIDGADGAHGNAGEHAGHCANCGTALQGHYCHACGQSSHVHKSLLHLGEEVLHGLLHFDAKGWRTIPLLVARPGQLTRRYIDGHRTRFVSPLALFLFMVFFMFFVASLTSGKLSTPEVPHERVVEARAELDTAIAEAGKRVATAEADLKAAREKGGDAAEAESDLKEAQAGLAVLEKTLKPISQIGDAAESAHTVQGTRAVDREVRRMARLSKWSKSNISIGWADGDEAVRHALANPELTLYKLKGTGSKFSFLLVPITLPFLWLMFFWRRGVTMYDHAVFSLYSLSFMALMFVLMFLLIFLGHAGIATLVFVLAPPIHMFAQLRGTYALGRWQALWRTVALMFIAAMVLLVYAALILVLSLR